MSNTIQKWEYFDELVSINETTAYLKAFGEDGWELVAAPLLELLKEEYFYHFFFKRPLIEEDKSIDLI